MGQPISSIRLLLAAVIAAMANGAVAADTKLPKAEQLLDRHIKATGGASAHKKLTTRKMVGTVKAKMGGHPEHEVDITVQAKAPNFWRLEVKSDLFSLVRCCSKDSAWESRDGEEPRKLDGAEKAQSLEQARFHAALNWRKHYAKVETVGAEKIDGDDAYKVQVDTKRGAQIFHWYDKETGRLVQSSRMATNHLGEFKIVSRYRDYEEFDGVWLATKMTQKLSGIPGIGEGSQDWSYDEIRHNEEVRDEVFTSPKSE